MKKLMITVIAAAFAAVVTSVVQAAVPTTAVTQHVPGLMNYQGYLADPSTGVAYKDGIYTLECRIYNAATSGTCLWGGKYSVYVKGGYFNMMLGDNSASALDTTPMPTYGNTELWKALWGSSATDTTRYLGVKPLENANNVRISSPTEITPRQQLLSSPFAFRAEHAQYADGSQSDFSVTGGLTVNGSTTLKGATTFTGSITANGSSSANQYFGPIKTYGNANGSGNVYLGSVNSASSDTLNQMPYSIYSVAKYLYFYPYYSMYFKPTAGNIDFQANSGYKAYFHGAGSFVSDLPTTTIGGTGATTVKGANVTLEGSSTSKVKGANIYITTSSETGRIFLQPNEFVFGEGELRWGVKSNPSVNSYKPYRRKTVTLTVAAGGIQGSVAALTDFEYNNFDWSVSTWHNKSNYRAPASLYFSGKSLCIDLDETTTPAITFEIVLFGVNKNWVD